MGTLDVVDGLRSVALAIALASIAGLRAWLPLFLGGLLCRLDMLHLGPSFQFLASNEALIAFGLATLIELVGDKFPAVDHALDVIGTVLRPAAGALLAASAMWQISDPLTALALGTALGAPAALVPHAAKASLRAASTAFTAGIANPVLSILEDVITVALFVLAVAVPVLVVALLLLTGGFVLRKAAARRRTATA